eukprot:1614549-Amphidinium_carterae.1
MGAVRDLHCAPPRQMAGGSNLLLAARSVRVISMLMHEHDGERCDHPLDPVSPCVPAPWLWEGVPDGLSACGCGTC